MQGLAIISLRGSAAIIEQHALLAAGRLQRQVAGAVRSARRDRAQQLKVLLVQRGFAAGRHGHRAKRDGEAGLLGVRAGEGIAVGLAAQRAANATSLALRCGAA